MGNGAVAFGQSQAINPSPLAISAPFVKATFDGLIMLVPKFALADGDILLNAGLTSITLMLANIGHRPVQVGATITLVKQTLNWHLIGNLSAICGLIQRRARTFGSSPAKPAKSGLCHTAVSTMFMGSIHK